MEEINNKRSDTKRVYYNPAVKRLNFTENKILDMLEKIRKEVHTLEVEWLQLSALSKSNKTENEISVANIVENTMNFDDVNAINASQVNFNPIVDLNVSQNQQFSESDSEESEMDEEENINVFL